MERSPSYEELFGGPILEDLTYDTADGFARIWTVQTTQGIDYVHFIAPVKRDGLNSYFVVESKPDIKFTHVPGPSDLSNSPTGGYIVNPNRQRGVQKLIGLHWRLLAVRTLDEKPSVSEVTLLRTPKYVHEFYMIRSWILAHPSRQIMIKLQIYVSQMRKISGYQDTVHATWGWDLFWGDLTGFNSGGVPESLNDYIHAGFGDMTKEPDEEFAKKLNSAKAPLLPFEKLWIDGFNESQSFSDDKLSPELIKDLKRRSRK